MSYMVKKFGVVSGIVAAALLFGAGPASASTSEQDEALVLPSSTSYDVAVSILREEAGSQSETSIEETGALASPTIHVEEYVDEEGQVVAAVAIKRPANARAVWWESPGCSSTGACITMNGRQYGYNGLGSLNGSWSGVSRIAAGNRTTGLWSGGTSRIVLSYKAKTYAAAISGDRIVRSS